MAPPQAGADPEIGYDIDVHSLSQEPQRREKVRLEQAKYAGASLMRDTSLAEWREEQPFSCLRVGEELDVGGCQAGVEEVRQLRAVGQGLQLGAPQRRPAHLLQEAAGEQQCQATLQVQRNIPPDEPRHTWLEQADIPRLASLKHLFLTGAAPDVLMYTWLDCARTRGSFRGPTSPPHWHLPSRKQQREAQKANPFISSTRLNAQQVSVQG